MAGRLLCVLWVASLLAGCVSEEPVTAAPASCYQHDPIEYVPVLVRINVHASYDLKDPESFRETTPAELFAVLNDLNPGKYELADGVIPNLILDLTATNDGQNHYGASLSAEGNGEGYLFSYSWPQTYVTARRLIADVAVMTDRFITEGWQRGACS